MDDRWTNAGRPVFEALTDWNPWAQQGGADFPLDALPSAVADWASMRAAQTGADVNAFAVAGLQIASGVITHQTRLKPKRHESYLVGPVLWSILVGLPGTKKSIPVADVQRLFRTAEQSFANTRRDTVARLEKEGNADADKTVPPARRLLSNDATVERLAEILSRQDTGLSLVRDELSGWLNSMDRYGHKSDRPFWLEAAGGGSYIVDRVKGSRHVSNLSISVFGGIQPDKLTNVPGLTEDGFMQRFQPVYMSEATGETDEPHDHEIDTTFYGSIDRLAGALATTLELDKMAGAAWLSFSNEMTALSSTTIPSPSFGTYLAKQPRTLATLTLLLAMLDRAPEINKAGIMSGRPVPLVTLIRAKKILEEFFLPHAWTFYAQAVAKGEDLILIATMPLKAANDGRLTLTVRDMTRATEAIARLRSDAAQVRAALTPFVANGWIRPETEAQHNHTWQLNPALRGHLEGEMRRQVALHRALVAKISGARQI